MRASARRMQITRRPLASQSGPTFSLEPLAGVGGLDPWGTFGDLVDRHNQHFQAMGLPVMSTWSGTP